MPIRGIPLAWLKRAQRELRCQELERHNRTSTGASRESSARCFCALRKPTPSAMLSGREKYTCSNMQGRGATFSNGRKERMPLSLTRISSAGFNVAHEAGADHVERHRLRSEIRRFAKLAHDERADAQRSRHAISPSSVRAQPANRPLRPVSAHR